MQKKSFAPKLFTNPVIRKLGKVQDRASEGEGATYKGIAMKCLYFVLLTVAGVVLSYVLPGILGGEAIPLEANGVTYSFTMAEIGIVIVAAIFTVITPMVAWLIRPAIPVVGSLYSIGQGYLIMWSVNKFLGDYKEIAFFALVITLALVFTMAILYATRIIKVNQKFKTVITVLFAASIVSSIAIAVLYAIPATRAVAQVFTNNFAISIISSVLGIIIATLFLLSDFDAVEKTVEHNLPKKYEWAAAYGLIFTVIWLYLKVLNLLLKVTQKSKD